MINMYHELSVGSSLIRLKKRTANIYCVLIMCLGTELHTSQDQLMGLFFFLILHNNFINPHNTIVTIVIIVILHIRKLVEDERLVQSHTASKGCGWNLNLAVSLQSLGLHCKPVLQLSVPRFTGNKLTSMNWALY